MRWLRRWMRLKIITECAKTLILSANGRAYLPMNETNAKVLAMDAAVMADELIGVSDAD